MKTRYQLLLILFVLGLAGGLIYTASHYHSLYKDEQKRADDAEQSAKLKQATIDDMQVRQRNAAALDEKYTGELADAKATIESLRSDVATGKRRLQLNASCPKSDSAGTGGVVNASTPRLDDSAERDYWRLRIGIATITKQVNYLQDYIKQQCLK